MHYTCLRLQDKTWHPRKHQWFVWPYLLQKALYWPTLLLVLPSVASAWGEQHPVGHAHLRRAPLSPHWDVQMDKMGKIASNTAFQPPVCKETLKSPGCSWKGSTVLVVKGQPTPAFRGQRTGLLYKENTACKLSSRNWVTAKHQKAKGRDKGCSAWG